MSGLIWQRVLEERMPGPPDAGPVLAFADPFREAACIGGDDSVMAPLASRAVLRVHGADAQGFLHAQLTADILAMPVGASRLAAWCTPKGRVIATVHVVRRSSDFLLVLAADLAEVVLARLRMFILRAKVQVDSLHEDAGVLGCAGASAIEILAQLGVNNDAAIVGAAGSATDDHQRAMLVAGPETLADCWDRLSSGGVLAVGEAAWSRVLVLGAEPHVTAATREAFIPQMLNLDRLGAISFEKGCYPGQEIVARTRYLGQLKRRMFIGRTASGEPPVVGSELRVPEAEQPVGQVVTSAYADRTGECELLAVVRIEVAAQPLLLCAPRDVAVVMRPPPYSLVDD